MALGKRTLAQPDSWMDLLVADSVTYHKPVDVVWQPLYGERSTIRNHYTSATLHLSRHDQSRYRLNVEVRAYNEGVAFRYFFPEHPDAIFHKVTADLTDYTLPQGTMAWSEQWAQASFEHTPVDSLRHAVERPLTLQLPSGQWMALLDADVDDWCLTKFRSRSGHAGTLESVMYSPVDVVTYAATPWKLIMMASTPGQLVEHNYMVDNLNPPSASNADFSWVKPGKIMRCTRLTTEAGLQTIDFCAAHNIPYMLYDWKWYEPCTSHDGDATQVIDAIDMQRVIAYGREKGVGVWLYVNQHALARQMDQLFPLLSCWGVAGVKSGFVQYASHRWATWLHDMVRKAADNHLMMNIHDEFRPSGFSRTYPNLLTQEGICGNEEWPDATHNVTLPFTRMLCGAADYTICYYDKRLRNTHAHQLAASLVYYSPLLTIFWYDTPDLYHGEPEMEWFERMETTFDETRVLEGFPGKNIAMARRKGDTWWVAAMTNNEARRQTIDLSFLEKDRKYIAHIYADNPKEPTATKVECSTRKVKQGDVLSFQLQAKGGVALRLEPVAVAVNATRQLQWCHGKVLQSLTSLGADADTAHYDRMPRNVERNATQWHCRESRAEEWCSGFWPGILWMDYATTKDERIRTQAERYTTSVGTILQQPVFDHDLGFLFFCSYGKAYAATGSPAYKQMILAAADSLAKLFNPRVGTLLAWPRHVKDFGGHNTIMDTMMNLEMLFWAARNGGNKSLYDMAVRHAETTMKHHFRSDGTCYHVAVYNQESGKFIRGCTHQGYSDSSVWARGQSWAVYGYTVVYRETHDRRFLQFAQKVADAYLSRLPEDYVPYWDFNDPEIPNVSRDASAACVVASALLELSGYVEGAKGAQYLAAAKRMLASLSSGSYRPGASNPSFLLHSTGHRPAGTEIDASIIYADYYYMEALMRLAAMDLPDKSGF